MPLWGFIVCFITATLWAVSPIMAARGMTASKCTPNEINPIRSISFFLSAFIIALFASDGQFTLLTSPTAISCVAASVFLGFFIGDILYFVAIDEIGVSLAVPISNSYPMLVTLTSWLVLGEPVTVKILVGVATVVAGLLCLRLGNRKLKQIDSIGENVCVKKERKMVRGVLLAAGAGLAWAMSSPLTKLAMISGELSPSELTFYRSVALLVFAWSHRMIMVKFFPSKIMSLRNVPKSGWKYFMGSAVIGLSVGSMLYTTCIRVMPVAIVTAITATSPFMAAMFGRFFLKEHLTFVQWAGIVTIILGSIIVSI